MTPMIYLSSSSRCCSIVRYCSKRWSRESLCYWLANIVASDEHLPRNSFEWVSRDDILRVCAAFTHVLSDPRTEEESNGWVYMSIDTIANHLRWWAQLLCDNIVEPARRAAIADNVDTSHVGDFPVLLLYLSRTLAKA